MGKKKITKDSKPVKGKAKEQEREEPEKVVERPSAKKKGRKTVHDSNDLTLFSSSFEKRIGEFKNFYHDFLEKKAASENTDLNEEFEQVTEKVSAKIEEACSAVLKEDLEQAEKWIGEQQKAIQEQINKINNAYNETKNTLSLTGTFSESEIEQQLEMIDKKKADLQNVYDNYGTLRKRASKIYGGADEMDE